MKGGPSAHLNRRESGMPSGSGTSPGTTSPLTKNLFVAVYRVNISQSCAIEAGPPLLVVTSAYVLHKLELNP